MEIINVYHTPVMLHEAVSALLPEKSGGIYVDLTLGGGGHSRELLKRMQSDARLLGFDQDTDAMVNAPVDERFTFVWSNFRYLRNWLTFYGIERVDGILADLGVSSHHFDEGARGFSFRFPEEPLDMRMNRNAALTAAQVLNTYSVEELCRIFSLYGELKGVYRLATAIDKARGQKPLCIMSDLIEVVSPLLPARRERKELTKLMQALRIEVNKELDSLQDLLSQVSDVLNPDGRLVVLTYHSLEDRLVKNQIKTGNLEGKITKDLYGRRLHAPLSPIAPFPASPSEEEQERNPRSRSAKLRVAELTVHNLSVGVNC